MLVEFSGIGAVRMSIPTEPIGSIPCPPRLGPEVALRYAHMPVNQAVNSSFAQHLPRAGDGAAVESTGGRLA